LTLRTTPADGLLLFGHEHDAHAPFAYLLQQLVGSDGRAGQLSQRRAFHDERLAGCRRLEKRAELAMLAQQSFDFGAERRIVAT
jgi:hypothetical protein